MQNPIRLTALLGSLALALPAAAEIPGGPAPAGEDGLAGYRWESRPVLVFAPSASDPRYEAQIASFRDAAEALAERDIVVLADTDPRSGSALRRGIGDDDASVILVGKDGGVKLRAAAPVDPAVILDLVDGMPMRRREMQD